MIERVVPYHPRPMQRDLHRAIDDGVKHVMLVWHRRGGKTVGNVIQLLKSAVECRLRNPRFGYVAPYLKQAKAIAWDYLVDYAKSIPGHEVNRSDLCVDLPNGARVRLFGADNSEAMRGLYFDGVVLDEFGQINPSLRREVLTPALMDRDGWEVVCGTPKGRNQFYKLYAGDDATGWKGAVNDPSWRVFLRKASETGILPQHKLDEALREMGPEMYAQELECEWFAADKGSYYARVLERRRAAGAIKPFPPDTGLPVHTAWDLGIADATAVWFIQKQGPEVRLVDYYEAEGEALEHYVRRVQAKALERRFVYADHWVPHDADHRSLQTGKTLVQMAASLGLRMKVVPISDFNAGVEATRQILERSFIDPDRCKAGLDALESYRKKYNVRLDEYGDSAEHDWSSHAADALRTFAMAEVGHRLAPRLFTTNRPKFARMD